LAIARAAFLEGYSATSMAAIAALVGGSKGTLYGYFANKEALFGAVVQDLLDEHFLPVRTPGIKGATDRPVAPD
jgi:AcrR family transcriptional regulator